MNSGRALHASLLGTLVVIGAAMLFAGDLRRRAAAVSHELAPYVPPVSLATLPAPKRIALGRTLFMRSCAHCHGLDATGDEGPDLHDLWVSNRRVATVIKRGIKGEMPSFAKKHDDREVAELVAYVKSLQAP